MSAVAPTEFAVALTDYPTGPRYFGVAQISVHISRPDEKIEQCYG